MNPFDNFQQPQNPDQLQLLVTLAEEAQSLETAKSSLEQELKELNGRLNAIVLSELPEAMADLGLQDFTLADGTKIKINEFMRGSLPKEEIAKREALDWLKSNGLAGIVKTTVDFSFGVGEDNYAKNLIALAQENGYEPVIGEGVNHMTLCKAGREKLALAEELPLEKLGLFAGKKAVLR